MIKDDQIGQARSHRWMLGVIVVVALTTVAASMLLLTQPSLGLGSGALLAVASFAVVRAWRTDGSLFAARLVALGQGIIWFFLLIHGGLGLVFGPLGWSAAAIAGRASKVAAVLLAVPAAFLTVSWAPALFGGSDLGEALVVLILVPPAVLGAVVFARASRHEVEEPISLR